MKLRNLLSLLLVFAFGVSEAQNTPPSRTRSGDGFTQVDNYVTALKRLGIPSGATPTLDASTSVNNTAKLFFNTTDTALYVYRDDLSEWLKVSADSEGGEVPNLQEVLSKGNSANNLKITNLADGTDPLDAVNKKQLDGIESPFNVIDVPQQAYTDKAINVKAFENQLHGMTYSEGSIDFGISRDNIHEMGLYSFKIGINNITSGVSSFSTGQSNIVTGNFGTSFGLLNTVSGAGAIGFGERTESSGAYTTSTGLGTIANEFASLSIGIFSTGGNPQTGWINGSPIFKVGNGTSESNRKNAYVLYNDGRSEQERDMEVTEIGQGFVLKSPDGTRWRITIDNDGALTTTNLN